MTEKTERDMRHTTEFILSAKKVYTETELLNKDFVTYFAILDEAKQIVQEEIARAKAREDDRGI